MKTLGLDTKKFLVLAGICVLTIFCYHRTLHNQFTNWDDDVYVSNDTTIRALNLHNLKTIFTEDITKNNYHPFCMLSLAINYQFAQLVPRTYYLTNILIHVANTVLVFFLLILLTASFNHSTMKKIPLPGGVRGADAFLIASLGSLWFGVHPLHVESVSWIAERKDVLYTFFYLLGLIVYIKPHVTTMEKQDGKIASSLAMTEPLWLPPSGGRWGAVFLLFIASCLSKPMAVVFPLSLLAIDFLSGKKLEFKLITQKSLFFLVALLFGAYAYYTQNSTGAIADFGKLTLGERTMYASYGFVMYLAKLFWPTFLSTFYPYPYRFTDGSLPFIYYASPFIALAIIIIPIYIAYKRKSPYLRILVFGMAFFIANLIFVLQFISCGAAIMADRYSYVSSIGIIFMVAFFVNEFITHYPSLKTLVLAVMLVLSAALSYLCYQRTAVWHNSETLLTDAIKKYPYRALLSYKWLGNYYMDKQDTDKALENYGVLAQLNAADAKIYDVIGNIYRDRGDYKSAAGFYKRSLDKENNVYITYTDMAMAEVAAGDSANGTRDYLLAVRLNKDAEKRAAELSFNMVQQKKYKPVIAQYNLLMLLNPNNPFYYFYRGCALFGENQMQASINDFNMSLRFKSKDVSPVAAYNLAVACDSIGNDSAALRYANMAIQFGTQPKPGFIEKLKRKASPH